MAAVFPLDTTKPWTFNGVTYEYDADDDRWYVVSTIATDQVVDGINSNQSDIDVLTTVIDQEIENRNNLLSVAASKNNQQDADIAELDQRVDAIGQAVGALTFKGRYTFVLEKSEAACQAVQVQCLIDAAGDIQAIRDCSLDYDACISEIDTGYSDGSFTTVGTNVIADVDEIIVSAKDLDGLEFDWLNLVDTDDYIELFEINNNDTALYQVIEEPQAVAATRTIRIKFLKQTGEGDGNFNLEEEYELRVIKASQGLDIIAADERYIQKPYTVYFEDSAVNISPVAPDGDLKNGELWYDTDSLELFVYNNNAWTASARPPTSDITIKGIINDVDELQNQAQQTVVRVNSLISDLMLENNIYYSDDAPTGDITGTLRNGDLWIDSDDLTIKFYSGGAWINPDRQVGGDYLEKEGGNITGELTFTKDRCNDVGCGPIHISPGNSSTSWSLRQDSADFLNFDANVGSYNEVIWFAPDGGATFSGKVELLNTTDVNHEGFTIHGTTKDGVPGNLLQAYHNSGNLPDAVNYSGVISSNTNIVNKQYVDDIIAEDEWEWHSNEQADSIYVKDTVHWTYIDTNTIKLNISQHSLQDRSWNYPNTSHQAAEFPISITGLASAGSTVPVLSGKTSSIRSLAYQGNKYFQIYVPIDNQFIWEPTAVSNLASVKVKIHGYL